MTLKYVPVEFKDVPDDGVFIYDRTRWAKGHQEIVSVPHNAYRLDVYEVKVFGEHDRVRVIKSVAENN